MSVPDSACSLPARMCTFQSLCSSSLSACQAAHPQGLRVAAHFLCFSVVKPTEQWPTLQPVLPWSCYQFNCRAA